MSALRQWLALAALALLVGTTAFKKAATGGVRPLAPPTIDQISRTGGAVGCEFQITGTNLTGAQVAIGATKCTNVSVDPSGNSLWTEVPRGAASGKVSVTVNGRRVESVVTFAVRTGPVPTITAVTPASSRPNTWVMLTGTGFEKGLDSYILIDGVRAPRVEWLSASQAKVLIPAGAQTGRLTVSNPYKLNQTNVILTVVRP